MKRHGEQPYSKRSPRKTFLTPKVSYPRNLMNNPITKDSNIKSIKHSTIKPRQYMISPIREQTVTAHRNNRLFKHNTQLTSSIVLNHHHPFTNHNTPYNPIKNFMSPKKRRKTKQINLTSSIPIRTMSSGMRVSTVVPKRKATHEKDEMNLESIKHLGSLFRLSDYKRNIIIDNEGNSNLNMDSNPLKTFVRNGYGHGIDKGAKTSRVYKKIATQPNTFILNIPKETACEKNNNSNEHERLVEFRKIINLLNENIAKMKNMIVENEAKCEEDEELKEEVKTIVYEKVLDPLVLNDNNNENDCSQTIKKDFEEMIKINANNNWGSELTSKTKAQLDEINESVFSFINSSSYDENLNDFINHDNNNKENDKVKLSSVSFNYSDDQSKDSSMTSLNNTIDNNEEDNSDDNAEEEAEDNLYMKAIPCLNPHFLQV